VALSALLVLILFAKCVDNWWDGLGRDYRERQLAEQEKRRQDIAATERQEKRRREEKAAEERRKEELAAIEVARPPGERATLALQTLASTTITANEICRAHELLDPIAAKDRTTADVQRALTLLRVKEAPLLRAQRAEAENSRGLMCADGSMSPSCSCHGPHRGCCSHHGGVAGCEPLPSTIPCQ